MTNRTDLDKCCAQIELISGLINQPETFDLNEELIKLETKKKLLMTYKTRDYNTILKGLESGQLKPIALISEEIELVSAAEVEALMRKKAEEKLKKEAELVEKKRVAEEKVKKLHEAEARAKAAEDLEKAIELERAEAEKLKAEKKLELLKEIEDLEA